MPLTPIAPLGPVVSGAGPPCQLWPALSVRAIDVQMYGSLLAHVPGVPACPITQAACGLTNVTDDGWKLAGTGWARPDGAVAEWVAEADGLDDLTGLPLPLVDWVPGPVEAPPIRHVARPGRGRGQMQVEPDRDGDGDRGGHRGGRHHGHRELAQLAAARPAGDQLERPRRRRQRLGLLVQPAVERVALVVSAHCLSRPSVARRSLAAALALCERLLELGPGMVQVRLDRSLRPFDQRRYLLDAEPGVVVEQERVAQPGGQPGDELAHVHVLGRVGRRFGVAARGDVAHRPALPLGLAPVVPDQVGGDHEEVALRVVSLSRLVHFDSSRTNASEAISCAVSSSSTSRLTQPASFG